MNYEIHDNAQNVCNITMHIDVHGRLARLDQKVTGDALLEGWRQRLLFQEARALQLAEGELIHVDELVLLDAGARHRCGTIPLASALQFLDLCRNVYQNDPSALLAKSPPGQPEILKFKPTILSVPSDAESPIDEQRLMAWRRAYRDAAGFSPLIHAAIAWDAWLTLAPERSGAWRAPFIAALVLKARGLTGEFLLPIAAGGLQAKYRRHDGQSFAERLDGFLTWTIAAASYAGKQHANLKTAAEILGLHLRNRRRNSRLAAVADMLLRHPVVSLPMIARHLHMSQIGASKLMAQLGSTPRLATSRKRHRLWQVG